VKLHEKFMRRCIQLAEKGLGTTYPNPLVGAVLVEDQKIIAEGWHRRAGQAHAEVRALEQVKGKEPLSNCTLYVSLEPCSHHGRTPPCADLIVEMGIKKVVIGSMDPNPMVSGRGVARLEQAGCEVTKGVLEEACDALNRRFFTFHKDRRPYIILKWAETADGFIAPPDQGENTGPSWISNQLSRQQAHKLRSTEQAILVGAGTVVTDNPELTARSWNGEQPIRVVLDPKGMVPSERKVFNKAAPTMYISRKIRNDLPGVTQLSLDETSTVLEQLCTHLYNNEIQSLLVEGGGQTLAGFIENDLWDEAIIYRGPKSWGNGLKSPHIKGQLLDRQFLRDDLLIQLKNPRS